MKKIFVVGNSHAHFFTMSPPGTKLWSDKYLVTTINNQEWQFHSCSIGPTTAWSFAKKHFPNMLAALQVTDASDGDYILVPVGEVDCRLHLPRQAFIQNRDISDIVSECLDKFFRVFLALRDLGYNPIAWGGHPSSADGIEEEDKEYPKYGDVIYRNEISKIWSSGLKERCSINKIIYASILEDLIDESGKPRPGIFQDGCHLANNTNLFSFAAEKIVQAIEKSNDSFCETNTW